MIQPPVRDFTRPVKWTRRVDGSPGHLKGWMRCKARCPDTYAGSAILTSSSGNCRPIVRGRSTKVSMTSGPVFEYWKESSRSVSKRLLAYSVTSHLVVGDSSTNICQRVFSARWAWEPFGSATKLATISPVYDSLPSGESVPTCADRKLVEGVSVQGEVRMAGQDGRRRLQPSIEGRLIAESTVKFTIRAGKSRASNCSVGGDVGHIELDPIAGCGRDILEELRPSATRATDNDEPNLDVFPVTLLVIPPHSWPGDHRWTPSSPPPSYDQRLSEVHGAGQRGRAARRANSRQARLQGRTSSEPAAEAEPFPRPGR